MYQKFIQYAMARPDILSMYSMKNSPFEQEKCVVELLQGNERIKYVLNPKTRVFEEQTAKSKNNPKRKSKTLPTGPEDEER